MSSVSSLNRGWLAMMLAVFASLGIPAVSCAQSSDAGQAQKPVAPDAGGKSPAASAWDRLVYVPFRNLQQTLAGDGAVAIVPVRVLNDWWQKLQALEARPVGDAAIGGGVAEARYDATIEGDLARVRVELAVRALTTEGLRLPLRFGEAALGELSCEDKRVWLRATGDGDYEIRLPEPGLYRVQFEMGVKVKTTPDGRELDFETPRAVTSSLQVKVPSADQAFELEPSAAAVETAVDEGASRLTARLPAAGRLRARWRPRSGDSPMQDALASVRNTTMVRLGDGLIQTDSRLDHQVLRGGLERVEILAPVGARILEVTAPGLKTWNVAPGENRQTITVELLGSETKRLPVRVLTEAPLPLETFPVAGLVQDAPVHGVHAGGGWRENGVVVLSGTSDLAVVVEQQQGLIRIEPGEIPQEFARPDALAWRYFNPGFDLQVTARPIEPRVQAQRHSRVVFREDEMEVAEDFEFQVERAPVFELRFGIPEGLVVDRVDCELMKSHQVLSDRQELVVTLRDGCKGDVRLQVTARRPLGPIDGTPQVLKLLEPRGVARNRGQVWTAAAQNLELVFDDRVVERLQASTSPPGNPPTGTRWLAGWEFPSLPEFTWRMTRRSPRLSATVATTVRVRRELAEVETLVAGSVQYAGLDTIRLAIPESLADSLQVMAGDVQTPPVRQQGREDGAEPGWVFWKVVLQRPVLGAFQLRLRADQKLTLPAGARQTSFSISPVRIWNGGLEGTETVVNPTSVEGQVVLQRDRTLSVGAEADAAFESIDLRELTLLPPEGDLAFRYYSQPEGLSVSQALTVAATQLEIQPVLETLVSKGVIEAVVTEDAKVTCRMRYELRTSERQRLDLELPKDSIPLDAVVDGKRVELERAPVESSDKRWDAYQIPVSRNRSADQPFVMALIFQAPYNPRPLPGMGGNLQLHIPRLGRSGTGEGVVIQQLRAAIWVPQEFGLVGAPEGFTAVHPASLDWLEGARGFTTDTSSLDQWFGNGGAGLYSFQTAGRAYEYSRLGETASLTVPYWKTNFFTWWISGAIFAAGVVLTATSWTNRVSILLLGALLLSLLALSSRELVIHLLGAARFGLIAALAWWCVQGLRKLRLPRFSEPLPVPLVLPPGEPPVRRSE